MNLAFNLFGTKIKISKETISKASSSSSTRSSYITNGLPIWRNFNEDRFLLDAYLDNPVVQTAINKRADAFANGRFVVEDLKTGEKVNLDNFDKDKGVLKTLITSPNPMQSTFEWLRQFRVNQDVFGNEYAYASIPAGYENIFTYQDINVINNLAPYCIAPVLTGKWLEASTKDEIISKYVFTLMNGKSRDFNPNVIFHRNDTNIKFDENFTQGRSRLLALQKPITNIDKAYESRNVLIRKRGAIGMITSDDSDANGRIPMTPGDKKEVQKDFEEYGLMEDQYGFLITNKPIKYTKMAMNVADLKLFEEIEADAIAIANQYDIPELLMKYYITGATFENMKASIKQFYDSTIIPMAEDFMLGFNRFLKIEQFGYKLSLSYDHIKVLQADKKDEATANNVNEKRALSAFKIGAITYGEYLKTSGLQANGEKQDRYIFDLDDREISIILGKLEGNQ